MFILKKKIILSDTVSHFNNSLLSEGITLISVCISKYNVHGTYIINSLSEVIS